MAKTSKKIVSSARLAALLSRRRGRGEKIVFTNGVFDLLHAGHVTVLEKARALGDCLVVGLNTDESVRRLKGPKRPVCPLSDRQKVLAGLESVDFVTSFGEDTPQKLIERLKPTILVKGGDYSVNQMVGRELVKKVVRVPLVKGRSTTNIVERILKAYGHKN
jgi:rfaE bifunctional protein nucleotidyltransferase chain/domain